MSRTANGEISESSGVFDVLRSFSDTPPLSSLPGTNPALGQHTPDAVTSLQPHCLGRYMALVQVRRRMMELAFQESEPTDAHGIWTKYVNASNP